MRTRFLICLSSVWLLAGLDASEGADTNLTITIPGGNSADFSTNLHVIGSLGYSAQVHVVPTACYHFQDPPTEVHDGVSLSQGTVDHCQANYTITLVDADREGWITVSGRTAPGEGGCGSCTGGGGGVAPSGRKFDVSVTELGTWARFTIPSNGTNSIACCGSTNDVEVKVLLGDSTAPRAGTVNFSVAPTTLGTFTSNSVSLTPAGLASTKFIASTNSGGSGTIIAASATGTLKDQVGTILPDVSTNLTVRTIRINASNILWYFGGEPTPTGFASGGTNTVLTAEGPTSGVFRWDVIAGTDKVSFENGTDTITKTNLNTAALVTTAASSSLLDVIIRLTYDGTSLCSGSLTVYAPKKVEPHDIFDVPRGASCNVTGVLGWASLISYKILDQFGNPVPNVAMNEKFGAETKVVPNDWGVPAAGDGDSDSQGIWGDALCLTGGAYSPHPLVPQTPLSTTIIDIIQQEWYCGSSTSGKGVKVMTDDFTRYLDHGRHENVVSPP